MNDTPIEEETVESPNEATPSAEQAEDVAVAPLEGSAVEGPRLVLKRLGQETDIAFAFAPPAIIGRFDPSVGPVDVDLGQIDEAVYVSRRHARIFCEDDVYKIQDLGSSNGTYVLRGDFEKVEDAELTDGDEVSFGNARFVFHA